MTPWLSIAQKELGISEIRGPAYNPRILEYHRETTLRATSDEVPWCSAFVCAILEWSGIPSTRSARARSYENWGIGLESPRTGCVVVLWRGSKDGTSGHVGFYVGETKDKIVLLGGNQGDKVSVQSYPKEQIIAYRWPSEYNEIDPGLN